MKSKSQSHPDFTDLWDAELKPSIIRPIPQYYEIEKVNKSKIIGLWETNLLS